MAFEFDIKANVDLSELGSKLNAAKSEIERARILETVKAGKGQVSQKIVITAEGKERGLSDTLKVTKSSLDGLTKSARANVSEFKKLTNTQKGSALQIRNLVGYLKQQIASTRIGTKEYASYQQRLENATRAQLAAQGIQQGSIAALQAEASTLRQLSQVRNLDGASREQLTNKILANEAAQRRASGIEKGSIADKRAVAAALQSLSERYEQGSAKQLKYAAAAERARASLNTQKSAFGGIIAGLGKLATVQAGFVAVQSLIGQAAGALNQFVGQQKAVEGFTLALQNVGLSAGEASEALKQASNTANALGAPIQQVEKAYKRMVPALRAVGASSQETDKFIEGISARSQTLGLSTEESGRFMEAFAQVLSKGKLQAEELNQQISELDGAFRTQLADSLGVTTQQLEKMISSSQVTADVFVKAFNRMQNGTEALRARVESGNFTIQQLQNLIRNLEVENLRRIGAAIEPGIKAFLDIGRIFQEFIRDITQTQFGQFLANTFNGVVTGARAFIQALLGAIKVVADLLAPVFALINAINSLLQPIGGLGGILGFLVSSLVAAKVASIAFGAALNFKGKIATFTQGLRLLNVGLLAFNKSLGEIKAGQFRSALQSFTKSLTSLSKGLVQATAKWLGFGDAAVTALGKIGKAGKAGTAVQAIGPALPPSYIKQFPAYAKASMEVEAAQAAAAASTAKLSTATVALGGTLAAAAVAGAIAYGVWNEGQKAQKALSGSTQELDEYLDSLGQKVAKQPTFWGNFGKALQKIGNDIANFFGADASRAAGAAKAQRDFDASIGNSIITLKSYGVELGRNADYQKLSDAAIRDGLQLATKTRDAYTSQTAALEAFIKSQEDAGRGNDSATKKAKENLAKTKEEIGLFDETVKGLQRVKDERIESGKATQELTQSVEDLIDAQEKLQQKFETDSIERQTALTEKYGISAADSSKLAIELAKEEIATNEQLIRSLRKNIAEQKKKRDAAGTDPEDVKKASDQISKLEGDIARAQLSVAQGNRDLANAIVDEFARIADEGGKVSDVYNNIASGLRSGIEGVRSSVSSVIGSISTLVDTVAEREIEGLEVGDARRKQIVQYQLNAQKTLNDLQYQIDSAKLAAAYRYQQIEIQTAKYKLQSEAAIAAARGDTKISKALFAQADAQDQLLDLSKQQFIFDQKNLDIQRRIKNETLAQKAIQEKIDPRALGITDKDRAKFADVNREIQEIAQKAKEVGSVKFDEKAFENANESLQAQKDAAKELAEAMEKSSISSEAQRDASNQVANSVAFTVDALEDGVTAADKMNASFQSIKSAASDIKSEISSIASAMAVSGGAPRWMGGAVSSGQTYTVNDGGFGREAFVNSFGRMTMLPPGQNIQWRAPSSGTIIPANIVKQMQANRDINASLNVASTSSAPSVTLKAMGANNIDSGNLIQRVASAMNSSGGTQRITNNVTIQSQEPVTDASKIMTNVARMKLRNSRRI